MKIVVTNMMGVWNADIDIRPGCVTLVRGKNMVGKTSLALAVGSVLAQWQNPLHLAATRRSGYLRDESEAGLVTLEDDATEFVRWDLKSGEMTINQGAIKCSPATVGLIDFTELTGKGRVEIWEELFLPPPETLFKKIKAELEPRMNKKDLAGVLKTIEEQGWDSVNTIYQDRGRRAKNEWKAITAKNYGVKVAVDWRPDGWLSSYDGLTIGECEEELRSAQDAIASLHVAHAISAADLDRAKQAAKELPAEEEKLKRLAAATKKSFKALSIHVKDFPEVNPKLSAAKMEIIQHDRFTPSLSVPTLCPTCEAPLIFVDGKLDLYDDAAAAEAVRVHHEARQDMVDALDPLIAADNEVRMAKAELTDAHTAATTAEQRQSFAVEAKEDAAKRADEEVANEEDAAEVQAAQERIERLRIQLDMVTRRAKANEHHNSVALYSMIASLLGPKGVRAKAMETAMGNLDKFLAIVADQTGWPRVEVDKTYNISIGKRATLKMCSESERWRAQASLQIAIARLTRDSVIVLDRADVMDNMALIEVQDLLAFLLGRDNPPAVVILETSVDSTSHWMYGQNVLSYVFDGPGTLISET